tara:strand:- start:66 stop:389 length:324 start_codon:yes stop_codon:yes gene_type:complete
MLWPPLKAWTSKSQINGSRYFVAINYGGELKERWIIMTSVLYGNVSIKISWSDLQDPSKWVEGWEENDLFDAPAAIKKQCDSNLCTHPSEDSGLSIPISKKSIRPWF